MAWTSQIYTPIFDGASSFALESSYSRTSSNSNTAGESWTNITTASGRINALSQATHGVGFASGTTNNQTFRSDYSILVENNTTFTNSDGFSRSSTQITQERVTSQTTGFTALGPNAFSFTRETSSVADYALTSVSEFTSSSSVLSSFRNFYTREEVDGTQGHRTITGASQTSTITGSTSIVTTFQYNGGIITLATGTSSQSATTTDHATFTSQITSSIAFADSTFTAAKTVVTLDELDSDQTSVATTWQRISLYDYSMPSPIRTLINSAAFAFEDEVLWYQTLSTDSTRTYAQRAASTGTSVDLMAALNNSTALITQDQNTFAATASTYERISSIETNRTSVSELFETITYTQFVVGTATFPSTSRVTTGYESFTFQVFDPTMTTLTVTSNSAQGRRSTTRFQTSNLSIQTTGTYAQHDPSDSYRLITTTGHSVSSERSTFSYTSFVAVTSVTGESGRTDYSAVRVSSSAGLLQNTYRHSIRNTNLEAWVNLEAWQTNQTAASLERRITTTATDTGLGTLASLQVAPGIYAWTTGRIISRVNFWIANTVASLTSNLASTARTYLPFDNAGGWSVSVMITPLTRELATRASSTFWKIGNDTSRDTTTLTGEISLSTDTQFGMFFSNTYSTAQPVAQSRRYNVGFPRQLPSAMKESAQVYGHEVAHNASRVENGGMTTSQHPTNDTDETPVRSFSFTDIGINNVYEDRIGVGLYTGLQNQGRHSVSASKAYFTQPAQT